MAHAFHFSHDVVVDLDSLSKRVNRFMTSLDQYLSKSESETNHTLIRSVQCVMALVETIHLALLEGLRGTASNQEGLAAKYGSWIFSPVYIMELMHLYTHSEGIGFPRPWEQALNNLIFHNNCFRHSEGSDVLNSHRDVLSSIYYSVLLLEGVVANQGWSDLPVLEASPAMHWRDCMQEAQRRISRRLRYQQSMTVFSPSVN